jgi:hypothetical protein
MPRLLLGGNSAQRKYDDMKIKIECGEGERKSEITEQGSVNTCEAKIDK